MDGAGVFLNDGAGSAARVEIGPVKGDAHELVDGGGDFSGGNGAILGDSAIPFAGADDLAVTESTAGEADAHDVGPVVATIELGELGGASEFSHGDDQRPVEEVAFLQITNKSGDEVIEDREEGFEAALDTAVGGDIVSVCVPSSRGSVMAEVECDEGDAGFDESAGHECLLTPGVIGVASVGFGSFEGEVKGFAGGVATDEFDGLLSELVGGFHEAGAVDIAADAVEVLEEGATIVNAIEAEAFGELEGAFDIVGDEGVVFFSEPTTPSEVGGGFHGGDVGGDAGAFRATEFSDDGGDGRVHVSEWIDAWGGFAIAGLHDHVGFVVAV